MKKSELISLVREVVQIAEKKKGVDGKACWKGYRYAGTKNGKDVCIKAKGVNEHETDPNLELTVGDYQTKHYHMCPGAKTLYQDIESKVEDIDLAVRAAKLQDALFAMEEMALERGATEADVFAAEAVANQIMGMAEMMGLAQEHSYIQGHVDKIKAAADGVEEAVTQMYVTPANKQDIKTALKKKGVTDTSSVDKAKPGEVIAVEETLS